MRPIILSELFFERNFVYDSEAATAKYEQVMGQLGKAAASKSSRQRPRVRQSNWQPNPYPNPSLHPNPMSRAHPKAPMSK